MKSTLRMMMAMAALLAVSMPVDAQNADRGRRAGARAQGVEGIMRMRERLELSEQQVADLDAIRRDQVAERSATAAELAELRSQLSAGQIQRSEVMAFMEDVRAEREGVAEQRREQLESILTEEQLTQVQQFQRRARTTRARGGQGFRGRSGQGMRGRPGLGRGGRGAPGMRGGRQEMRRRGFRGGQGFGGDAPDFGPAPDAEPAIERSELESSEPPTSAT